MSLDIERGSIMQKSTQTKNGEATLKGAYMKDSITATKGTILTGGNPVPGKVEITYTIAAFSGQEEPFTRQSDEYAHHQKNARRILDDSDEYQYQIKRIGFDNLIPLSKNEPEKSPVHFAVAASSHGLFGEKYAPYFAVSLTPAKGYKFDPKAEDDLKALVRTIASRVVFRTHI